MDGVAAGGVASEEDLVVVEVESPPLRGASFFSRQTGRTLSYRRLLRLLVDNLDPDGEGHVEVVAQAAELLCRPSKNPHVDRSELVGQEMIPAIKVKLVGY